jgi:hypothetical protein
LEKSLTELHRRSPFDLRGRKIQREETGKRWAQRRVDEGKISLNYLDIVLLSKMYWWYPAVKR